MPSPSELQRELDAESTAERYAREYRDVAKWNFDNLKAGLLAAQEPAREPTPGGHECKSPVTNAGIFDQQVQWIINHNHALCGEIAFLRATVESQAQKISILTAELAVMREQRLLDDRRWADSLAGRGDPDQKPERCQACGWPKHPEEHGG